MSRVDLHPEELLDLARRGALAPADRERLHDHAAHCPACAFELSSAGAFDAEGTMPPEEEDAAVDRVMAATMGELFPGAGASEVRRPAPSARPRAPRALVFIAAAAVLLVLGVGGAAAMLMLTEPEEESVQVSAAQAAREAAPENERAQRTEEPIMVRLDELRIEVSMDGREARPRRRVRARPEVTPEEPPLPQRTAAELLAEANAERSARRYERAAELYRELQRTFPRSREQRVSRVALGRVLLDRQGDPASALAEFDIYLAGGGGETLAAEARVGRALALGRLGRRTEERTAWEDVVRRHPSSLHAERARRRLSALGPP